MLVRSTDPRPRFLAEDGDSRPTPSERYSPHLRDVRLVGAATGCGHCGMVLLGR